MIKTATDQDDAVEALLEPGHRVLLLDAVLEADSGLCVLALCDARTGTVHHDKEVHAKDTDGRVVPGAEIDVLLDAKAKVASLTKVAPPQLVLLDLESTLQDLLRLRPTNRHVHRDLLVTTDAERPHSVARLARHWRLARQLLQHLCCTSQPITRLAHGNV